jgi:hypothetical protein
MKNNIFILFFVLTSGSVFAQVNTENVQTGKIKYSDKNTLKSLGTKKPEVSEPVVVEETEPVIILRLEYNATENSNIFSEEKTNEVVPVQEQIEPEKSVDEQIAIQDSYIKAINIKIEAVKNNPDQHNRAEKSGWYDQMEQNKKVAELKKIELINSKK